MITTLTTKKNPIDVLAAAQDDLVEKLLAGRISPRRMEAVLAKHIATLTGAGFKASEARDCFNDAVSTVNYLNEEAAA